MDEFDKLVDSMSDNLLDKDYLDVKESSPGSRAKVKLMSSRKELEDRKHQLEISKISDYYDDPSSDDLPVDKSLYRDSKDYFYRVRVERIEGYNKSDEEE